jgi:hypothetical protein
MQSGGNTRLQYKSPRPRSLLASESPKCLRHLRILVRVKIAITCKMRAMACILSIRMVGDNIDHRVKKKFPIHRTAREGWQRKSFLWRALTLQKNWSERPDPASQRGHAHLVHAIINAMLCNHLCSYQKKGSTLRLILFKNDYAVDYCFTICLEKVVLPSVFKVTT